MPAKPPNAKQKVPLSRDKAPCRINYGYLLSIIVKHSEGLEWAIHSCSILAALPPETALPARLLAAFFELPEAYLAKQLQKLSGAGLVETRRGPKGGYALAKAPADITLLALVNAIDGSERHFRCSELRQCGPSGVSRNHYPRPCCIARSMWKAEAAWRAELTNTTLKDIQMMGYDEPPRASTQSAQLVQRKAREIMTLSFKTLHRTTAALVLAFIAAHMITHVSGLWGITAYNSVQNTFRLVYQNPILEPILLASVAFQLASGLILLIRKMKRGLRGPWDRIQVFSGGIILFFTTQHMVSFVISRWIDGLDTNFYWPASVMSGAPFIWYFVLYYFAGVTAIFIHIGSASRLYFLRSQNKTAAIRSFWALTSLGIALAVAIELMLAGAFFDVTLPPEWIAYLQQFIPSYTP